jgi:hypothetical protein
MKGHTNNKMNISENKKTRWKTQKEREHEDEAWKILGKKRATIKIDKLRVFYGASNGVRFLDNSIIYINEQNQWYIEQIREGLNKEFEWDGPPVSFHALKRPLVYFMKWKCSKLKKCWVCDPLFMPPTYINIREWEKLKAYWADEKFIKKTSLSFLLCTCYCDLLLVVKMRMYIKNLKFDFMSWVVCFVGSKWFKPTSMSIISIGMGDMKELGHLPNWYAYFVFWKIFHIFFNKHGLKGKKLEIM